MTSTPWFRNWFGREYLAMYPHRDGVEARQAVHLLRAATGRGPGTRVLDLACGAGRHLVELDRIGYRTTGMDLSWPMLTTAQDKAAETMLVRGDMRQIPFRSGSFEIVTSYFTSFGYFDSVSEDQRVLTEVRRVLRPGGTFLLDFMNRQHVIANLQTTDRRKVSGVEVTQNRRLVDEGEIVEKNIVISPRSGGIPEREFIERVRLYRPEELEEMLKAADLSPKNRFGGYDCAPFLSSSSRCIVVAEA